MLVLVGLYTYQSSLIYPASLNDGHGYCATPDEYDMPYELVNLKTEDGETLQCYLLKQDPQSASYSNKTVLILSPNAGNIGHALPIVSIFTRTLDIMFSFIVIEDMVSLPAHQVKGIEIRC